MPVTFDASTLIAVHVFVRLTQAFVLLYVWHIHRRYPPARGWAIGASLGAIGLTVTSLRGVIPLWVAVLIGNPLLLIGWMVFDFGIVAAAGGAPPRRLGVVLVAAATAALAWYLLVSVNYPARVLAVVSCLISLDICAIIACLRHRGSSRVGTFRLLAGLLGLLSLSNLLRAVDAFQFHLTTILSITAQQTQFAFASIGFSLTATFTLLLLTSQKLQEELDRQARHDSLTNAYNRRALEELADREWARAQRRGYPLAMLVVDLDHFKQVNDKFGHEVGDRALVAASDWARAVLRPEDVWCRYGGEEFVALLPQTDGAHALLVAERLRQAIEQSRLPLPVGALALTVSVGVAEGRPGFAGWRAIVEAADRALYRAKAEGRNRALLAPEPIPA
jgi:diguanylate cyclase (GGDEF)-like protein